ncbi:MFS transporter [Aneurinibacillus sp. UBA3580]|jgi:MFS family permease|uniref:MFS transporter n=1 Tax=Aneurinibacillus sp. UBA3580 TaxID=1946041 RepID=UPI002579FD0C|nr:MFS transporter [Aneurinibacillus sp. UBA3580]
MRDDKRIVSVVLFTCVFLFVYTEVLLSPFYPQFFQKVFGVEDYGFTGWYIFACRLTVVLASPVWGFLSKKIDSKRLLIAGQAGTAISCALMAISENEQQFLVFSIMLLIFKSSYLLLYTIMIQAAGSEKKQVTGTYHAVLQSAIIASTITSGWVINLAAPLQIFWWIALLDLLQGIVCFIVFKKSFRNKTTFESVVDKSEENDVQGTEKNEVNIMFFVKMALLIFTLHFSVNVIRPFFTIFTEGTFHTSFVSSSILFLIPSLMAVLALPVIKRCSLEKLPSFYKISGWLLFLSLIVQGISPGLGWLIFSRCLFGFCLAICQAILDIYLFQRSQNAHYHYSILSSFQNLGLLLAPLSALALVEDYSLASPFIAAAFIFALHLIIVGAATYRNKAMNGTKTAE